MTDRGAEEPAGRPGRRSEETSPTTIEAILQRIIYERADGGFSIAVFEPVDGVETFVAKGPLWGLSSGETVALSGRWHTDPKWGRQLQVSTARPVLPATVAGIQRYLVAAKIKGVGPALAGRIVDRFGTETLKVIAAEPQRLQEVRGLGRARRTAVVAALQPRIERDAALVFLLDLGIGSALAGRIVETLGDDSVRTVREQPYRLAREVTGIGFTLADRIARSQGVAADDPARLDAGVNHALEQLANQGHTAPSAEQLLDTARELLRREVDDVAAAVQREVARGHVLEIGVAQGALGSEPGQAGVAVHHGMRRLMRAEASLAEDLARLGVSSGGQLVGDALDARLHLAAGALGFAPAGRQLEAIQQALSSGLMVVTGGPGTGKTTIIQGVIAASGPDKLHIALAAPTGRAARRLAEATGMEASTLHRLLEFDPRTRAFLRGRSMPLEHDLVIVDECSMVDTSLAAALCCAIRPGARLLLVGDADQLPSVGPGAVLDDIVRSDRCPVIRLDHIYRQAGESLIVDNAHRVCAGRMPVGGSRERAGDFYLLDRDRPEDIISTLLEVVLRRIPARLGLHPVDDIQVIVPMHRGTLGTVELNNVLRAELNPEGDPVGHGLRVGDKVLQVRNNYDLDVFNGDIGRVLRREGEHVIVRLGEREVACGESALTDLQLAYAITVHKSQGSEYPAVVLPLHGQHRMLLQRNLLYTALTRARRFAVLIGQRAAVGRAARNAAPTRRVTLLRQRLRGELIRRGPQLSLEESP